MIVATIGHQDYELASMADAEALLNIITRAIPITAEYIPGKNGRHWREEPGERTVAVEITNRPLLSREQFDALVAEASQPKLKEAA